MIAVELPNQKWNRSWFHMLRGYVFAVEDMLQRFARFYEVEAR